MNQKNCKNCQSTFEITDEDHEFYKKIQITEPTLCPSCRMHTLLAFRNERSLFKAKCASSGKEILSIYPPDTKYTVYDQNIWWGDSWEGLDYGQDYDFNRPFFDQFQELLIKVPRINLQNRNNENSEYCNDCDYMKNCYLCFNAEQSQDSYYTNSLLYSKDSMDIFWGLQCELCYECSKTFQSYHCFWCFNSVNLSDCYFCENCIGCKNCFGCIGLYQKQYCLYNKQLSKEKYEELIENFTFSHDQIEEAKKELSKLRLKVPHKNLEMVNCENCLGDYLNNCKNCKYCFDMLDNSENCKYFWDGLANNSYDCFNAGLDSTFLYQCVGCYHDTNIKFCGKCSASSDLIYCDYCFTCDKCFGCCGLRHKKYCILNKQYSKEEYEELMPKIIEHMTSTREWGEFFPRESSPYAYNDSMAMWYFPMKKENAVKNGFNWNDYQNPEPKTKSIVAKDLPQTIKETSEDILNKAIKCEKDGKLFRIIPQVFDFYKKHNIPIPHLCPDCRHNRRKAQTNPRKLYEKTCDNCKKEIFTTYSPERPEIVYCEDCYLKTIF